MVHALASLLIVISL